VQFNGGIDSIQDFKSFMTVDEIHFTGGGNTIRSALGLGMGISGNLPVSILNDAGTNTFDASLPLDITANQPILVQATSGQLSVNGEIFGGKSGITVGKLSAGSVILGGKILFSNNAPNSSLSVNGGSLTLTGNSPNDQGITQVDSSTLVVNAYYPNSPFDLLSNSTLSGTGTVQSITTDFGLGNVVSPGGAGALGTLTIAPGATTSTLKGSTFQVDVANPGASDQLIVGNGATVDLTGATLSLGVLSSAGGNSYTIIRSATGEFSGTITGTFAGLADGSTLSAGGRTFRINYSATAVTLTDVSPAAGLVLLQQPGNATANAPINPVKVQVLDQFGVPMTSDNGRPITIALGANPGGGTLGGTLTVNDVNGIATFSDLSVSAAGTGYTLVVSSAGLSSATSTPFDVTAPSAGPGPAPGGAAAPRAVSPGVFDPATATWYLRNSASPGAPDVAPFAYGRPGWIPVVGDWNGDGTTTIGVVDPTTETWYLRNSNSPGAPDIAPFQYGAPSWIPVVGDWNHTGHAGIGVFNPATGKWYLRNEASPGGPDANPGGAPFAFGAPGWVPVAGDWTGSGHAGIGVFDPTTARWYLRTEVGPGAPDANPGGVPFAFGGAGWKPVVGDWSGQGKATVGVVNPATAVWYLRNSNGPGAPDIAPFAYGGAGWSPLAGDWDFPALPQLAAGGRYVGATGAPLTDAELQAEVAGALDRLSGAGVDPAVLARLGTVSFSIGQLSGADLAVSDVAAGRVVVDATATGWGWFVDPTPLQDEEFLGGQAVPGSAASGRMDLLTVVLHELGHFTGWTELDPAANPDALMALTLGTGVRRTEALNTVFAQGSFQ
jgi:hypothetical protein